MIDIHYTLFHLLGGLGIFLIGINLMANSLKKLTGSKMKTLIEKLTNSTYKGILVGIFVTVILQSSSGTTALTISLIRSGLMTLPQGVGIIMGANIGTTVTAFLIGLNIKNYALPIMTVGALLAFFAKRLKVNLVGCTILGFGMLFYGLKLMGSGLKPLSRLPAFANFMIDLSDNPLLGVFAGTALTVLVQSSSATVGLLEELYAQNAIDITASIPVLFGDNIGTTITSVIAALGGSLAAKRASAFHVLFNLIGTVIFLTFFIIFKTPIVQFIVLFEGQFLDGMVEEAASKPHVTIALAHMFFNIANTFLLVWFVNHIVRLVKIIIPGKGEDKDDDGYGFNNCVIDDYQVIELVGS
ncbi:Na/Pi cotransporter family protein [Haloplasma contractile]|uniref:Na-Pi-cotransporter family protein n=1 Tax=Haloplasma contractile SSD-17B TaxID=1033810 RepID=F7PSK4_9MOLU|nr:Na/Pi cotransporter family protein [Haloplasma contractile]ERJ12604.1 Na-Pi-cotransporter family protein [Haloplasma contractile SSD-17B]